MRRSDLILKELQALRNQIFELYLNLDQHVKNGRPTPEYFEGVKLAKQLSARVERLRKQYFLAIQQEGIKARSKTVTKQAAKKRAIVKFSVGGGGLRFNPNVKLDPSQVQVKYNGRWMTNEQKKKLIRIKKQATYRGPH